jgi:plasmid stabilization system protein ParE
VRLILLDDARRQFEHEDSWWRAHRDAVDVFIDEFERTLERLSAAPELGQAYRRSRDRIVQRWLMPKTRCHVYYVVRDPDVIEIHSVWGARRGRGPRL